jgi:S-adenosylmethionine-diacylglycerol 3-amino-3-carboxypropyl transferase
MEALASSASWPREISPGLTLDRAGRILYGQVWEDADVLLQGLDVQPGHVCLSIASAGDNVLALLSRAPARVIAVDRSPAQIFCLELRVAAYRALAHEQVLELIGSRTSDRRIALYERCRHPLSPGARRFWDARPEMIRAGIGSEGRFERYFSLFRQWVLPLVHSRARVDRLLTHVSASERTRFYEEEWNTWRWRLLFRVFFSRFVMGTVGRERRCFNQVNGSVAAPILERTRHALTVLNPADNPYVHWILTGRHGDALPYALRPENFEAIRDNLDRLECRVSSLGAFLTSNPGVFFDRCNLSDVFEYVSSSEYETLLTQLVATCRPGARLAYWNMLADRTRPPALADRLRPATELAASLHRQDRAFFYRRFVLEDVIPCK